MLKDILEFLDENKFSYKDVHSDDTHVQVDCPLCGDSRKRLGILIKPKTKGGIDHPFRCFNCNSRGLSLTTLKKAINSLKDLNRKRFVEYKNGQVSTIKQGLAEKMHEIILKEDKTFARDYLLNERKISEEVVNHFKLGFRSKFTAKDGSTYDGGPYISIPGYENDKCVYIKYRSIDPDIDKQFKWKREKGCNAIKL